MNKLKTTAKAIREMPEPKVQVGYCGAYYLLKDIEPFAYTAGKYGWNFDAYDLGGLIVTTGSRNMVGEDANDIAHEYEEKAQEVFASTPWNQYRKASETVRKLREEFKVKALESLGWHH